MQYQTLISDRALDLSPVVKNPRFLVKTVLRVVVPALFWLGAIYSRSLVIHPQCAAAPQSCTQESVLKIDQLSLGMENPSADRYSFDSQHLAGVVALTVPAGWTAVQLTLGTLSPSAAVLIAGADLVLVLEILSWNGLLTELSHLIVQRPRPFVYSNPSVRGLDPAHYTSFYSGHTSFAAAATVATLLILWTRGAPLLLLIVAGAVAEALTFGTAYFRILAGRHFFTDVVTGAILGTGVATLFVILRRRRPAHRSH